MSRSRSCKSRMSTARIAPSDSRTTRVSIASRSRGDKNNGEVLKQILTVRAEKAKLLG